MGNTKNPVHAKVWLFDRERVIVGSHNISSRALGTNIETSVLFDDGEGVEKIGEWFEKVWGKGITEPQDR
jgi:phosphatidylserine/phosphatidylglycerophosphate/cardiolipin synthase-like enzyme